MGSVSNADLLYHKTEANAFFPREWGLFAHPGTFLYNECEIVSNQHSTIKESMNEGKDTMQANQKQAVVMDSPFLCALRAAGRERLATVLGWSPAQYRAKIEQEGTAFLQEAQKSYTEGAPQLFVAEAYYTLNGEKFAYFLRQQTPAVLRDGKGALLAIHLPVAVAKTLDPESYAPGSCIDEFARGLDLRYAFEYIDDESYRADTLEDCSAIEQALAEEVRKRHRACAVRIDGDQVLIGPAVRIGAGTQIRGAAELFGETVIGEDVVILGPSRVVDSSIADRVRIESSVIESSAMQAGSNIGPFSHLRPGAQIGEDVHIGNFVEVKKASLGTGTKAGHLAYIGDADVGAGVNISCGVIFCNYDGTFKHHTVVEDQAFIGSNANLVAPVHIEKEAYVAAGSTITKRVESGALGLERAKQENRSGYAAMKKARDQRIKAEASAQKPAAQKEEKQ